jgi:hypothetical protein
MEMKGNRFAQAVRLEKLVVTADLIETYSAVGARRPAFCSGYAVFVRRAEFRTVYHLRFFVDAPTAYISDIGKLPERVFRFERAYKSRVHFLSSLTQSFGNAARYAVPRYVYTPAHIS